TYVLAVGIALLFRELGVLEVRTTDFLAVGAVALLTTVPPVVVARRALRGIPGPNLDYVWMAADVAVITWGVHVSGGIESSWYIWYLAPAGAAAFVGGGRAAAAVSLLSTAAYVGSLVASGAIAGFGAPLFTALLRMAFLHGAASFSLWGIAELARKRVLIERLREGDARQLEELTRLTGALDQATRELQDANLRLLEADRLKSQFLANMSHELRTPLNSIIGFSEILLTRLGEQLGAKPLKFLQNINTSGQHLLGIINDILDLSKIEAGKMEVHPEPIAVGAVVEGVVHVMRGTAAKQEVEFALELPEDLPQLETDAVRFKQILYNLLSNAVKFSPPGSTVTVRGSHVPAANSPIGQEAIQLQVTDQGPGIHPSDHELIFQEFRQADGGTTRKHQGTGLGLALVRKFAELQGGAVTVDSTPGKGATFTVLLPRRFQGVVPRGAVDTGRLAIAAGKPRVLVIEDDPITYEKIGQALLSAFYVPFRARNGEEAITLAHALKPSAITLDLVLPGLDGWEVLKALKGDPATRDVPVVIVSVVDNRELGVALGAEDYLLKPIDPERLVARLAALIERSPRRDGPLLVVDDEPAVHAMLDAALEGKGYAVEHALSGEEALLAALRKPPTLVILDLMMPGTDGFEVARRMKEAPTLRDVPILVLTARDLTRADKERLAGRMTALVQKGEHSPAQIVAMIDAIVGRRAPGGERA
ncbi:MAG: response regulator, partial [Acidobacteria bacterium ACB2]|nr:response regulator [Acidobacteria bacterium ACB2]